mmetsp:Transcript_80849/g.152814  ORF Transcript_80849/g.152814 Transcript_80849/m.152814 type:complete len:213 (+) Transcript_80849:1071-1709(+)
MSRPHRHKDRTQPAFESQRDLRPEEKDWRTAGPPHLALHNTFSADLQSSIAYFYQYLLRPTLDAVCARPRDLPQRTPLATRRLSLAASARAPRSSPRPSQCCAPAECNATTCRSEPLCSRLPGLWLSGLSPSLALFAPASGMLRSASHSTQSPGQLSATSREFLPRRLCQNLHGPADATSPTASGAPTASLQRQCPSWRPPQAWRLLWATPR